MTIPNGANVENPIEDTALMAKIGANKICDFAHLFELKNAVTGTKFTFAWNKNIVVSNISYFAIRREEKIF